MTLNLKNKTLLRTSSSLIVLHLAFLTLAPSEGMAMFSDVLKGKGLSEVEVKSAVTRAAEGVTSTQVKETQENAKQIQKIAPTLSTTNILEVEKAARTGGVVVKDLTPEDLKTITSLTNAGVKTTTPEQVALLKALTTAGMSEEESAKFIKGIQGTNLKDAALVTAVKAIAAKTGSDKWTTFPTPAEVKAYAALSTGAPDAALAVSAGNPTENECRAYAAATLGKAKLATAGELAAAVAVGTLTKKYPSTAAAVKEATDLATLVGGAGNITAEFLADYRALVKSGGAADATNWAIVKKVRTLLSAAPTEDDVKAAFTVINLTNKSTAAIDATTLTADEIKVAKILMAKKISFTKQDEIKAAVAYQTAAGTFEGTADQVQEIENLLDWTGSLTGITADTVADYAVLASAVKKAIPGAKLDKATWGKVAALRTSLGKTPTEDDLKASLTSIATAQEEKDLKAWGVVKITPADVAAHQMIAAVVASSVPGVALDKPTWDLVQHITTVTKDAATEEQLVAAVAVLGATAASTPITATNITEGEIQVAEALQAEGTAFTTQDEIRAAAAYADALAGLTSAFDGSSDDLTAALNLASWTGSLSKITKEVVADYLILDTAVTKSVPGAALNPTTWKIMERVHSELKTTPSENALKAALDVIKLSGKATTTAIDGTNITAAEINVAEALQAKNVPLVDQNTVKAAAAYGKAVGSFGGTADELKAATDLLTWTGNLAGITEDATDDYAMMADAAKKAIPGAKLDQPTWNLVQRMRAELKDAPDEAELKAALAVLGATAASTPIDAINITADEINTARELLDAKVVFTTQAQVQAAVAISGTSSKVGAEDLTLAQLNMYVAADGKTGALGDPDQGEIIDALGAFADAKIQDPTPEELTCYADILNHGGIIAAIKGKAWVAYDTKVKAASGTAVAATGVATDEAAAFLADLKKNAKHRF